MKVLHILDELRPSGAEMMLRIAGPLWKKHGIECGLLATGDSIGAFAVELAKAGYTIDHLPRIKTPAHFMAVSRLIRQRGYSVVHQHVEGAGYWYSTAALAAGAGVVRTIHNNFLFSGWLRWVRGLQRRHLARRGVRFVAIAPGVRANELQRFGLRTELVLNWVADRFMTTPGPEQRHAARQDLGFSNDAFVLVTVGNCSPVKNHRVILEGIAACADLPQLRYLHVGAEEPGHPERQRARELGVEDRVRFIGGTRDALPHLNAADAYIMPSLYEGLPLAAIEALGTGLPGLLADVPGLKDIAAFFPSLLYFAPTAAEVESAIRQVVLEGAEARSRRTAGYSEICRQFFSAGQGVNDYATLYRAASGRGSLAS